MYSPVEREEGDSPPQPPIRRIIKKNPYAAKQTSFTDCHSNSLLSSGTTFTTYPNSTPLTARAAASPRIEIKSGVPLSGTLNGGSSAPLTTHPEASPRQETTPPYVHAIPPTQTPSKPAAPASAPRRRRTSPEPEKPKEEDLFARTTGWIKSLLTSPRKSPRPKDTSTTKKMKKEKEEVKRERSFFKSTSPKPKEDTLAPKKSSSFGCKKSSTPKKNNSKHSPTSSRKLKSNPPLSNSHRSLSQSNSGPPPHPDAKGSKSKKSSSPAPSSHPREAETKRKTSTTSTTTPKKTTTTSTTKREGSTTTTTPPTITTTTNTKITTKKEVHPKKEETVAPKIEKTTTTTTHTTTTTTKTTVKKDHSPQKEETVTPKKEKTPTPPTTVATTTAKSMPKKQETVTPKKEKTTSTTTTTTKTMPKKEEAVSPKKEKTATTTVPTPTPTAAAVSSPSGLPSGPLPTPQLHLPVDTLPGDDPTVLCVGEQYRYNAVTGTWSHKTATMIRVPHPNRGIAQGGMRACFEVFEVGDDGLSTPMVAKLFRRHIDQVTEKDYFNEVEIQMTAQRFVKLFREALRATGVTDAVPLTYLDSTVVRLPPTSIPEAHRGAGKGFFSYKTEDTREHYFTMERKLNGHFTKYTSNNGAVFASNEKRQSLSDHNARLRILHHGEAFSHFSLVESGGSLLICDIQGVAEYLTDPQIHTVDGVCYGMGNMGRGGMQRWLSRHRCTEVCRALRLPTTEGATVKSFENLAKQKKFRRGGQ